MSALADLICQVPGVDGPFESRITQDAAGSIPALRALLKPPPGGAPPPYSPAHVYAMLADAYWLTNDLPAGTAAVTQGQAVLQSGDDQVLRRRLLLTGLLIRAAQGDSPGALRDYDAATAGFPDSAPDAACVLLNRGFLRQFVGNARDAYDDLTRAYRIAGERGAEANRMLVAALLSNLYKNSGFPDEARHFADEVIEHGEKSHNREWLAEGYFRLGDVSKLVEDYAGAQANFSRALEEWKAIGSDEGVMASQQRLCETLAKLPDHATARATCAEAYRQAIRFVAPHLAKAVLGSQGEVELRDGHPGLAKEYFDRALQTDHGALNKVRQAEFTRLRGEARAQLGDYAGAFRDQSAYLDWVQHSSLLVHDISQIAVTRTKYEAAIQEQQQLRARDAAKNAAQEASRQLLERSILMGMFVLFLGMAGFLTWAQRRRQDIEREARATEERMSTMSRVVGGIAHDFNNQLTVMMQALGLLASYPAVGSEAGTQGLLQAIRQSCAACAQVTAQMLSFSRQQHLRPEPVPLGRFVAGLRAAFTHLAGGSVRVSCEVADPEPVALVDPRQLEAALLNLVSNARDALRGGGEVVIRVSQAGPDTVEVTVIDRGVGMTPEVLARATEPFYSTKPVGGGSGLGLSMVHGFATQSGGSMHISSEQGRGTTVSLTLPASPDAERAERADRHDRHDQASVSAPPRSS